MSSEESNKESKSEVKLPSKLRGKVKNELKNLIELEKQGKLEGGTDAIINTLAGALLGRRRENPLSAQISQVETMFRNARWYTVSNYREMLSQIYIEFGVVQAFVDMPVEDALAEGIEIQSKQIDGEDIKRLLSRIEFEDDLETIAQAAKWNRLFGGSGILVITNENFSSPFSLESINEDTQIKLRPVDLWELYWNKMNTTNKNTQVLPTDLYNVDTYSYYGYEVHESRVFRMMGNMAPSYIRPTLRGWGLSIIESVIRPLNEYLKSTTALFEIIDEVKIDVYKFENLAALVSTAEGEESVRRRITLANQSKNLHEAIVLDKNDDYEQKTMNISGLADIMSEIRTQLSSELRIPQSKLFGLSPSGFNAGGHDIENYNRMIESHIRRKIKKAIRKVVELRCMQELGRIPDDLDITFPSLRILTEEQEENIKTHKYNRVIQSRQAGEISSETFKDSCNADNLLPTQLEVNDETFPVEEPLQELDIGEGQKPKQKGTV